MKLKIANTLLLAACALLLSGCKADPNKPDTICLSNDIARVEIVPEWGGRVMVYGPIGKPSFIWKSPDVRVLLDNWFNPGGEKTWIGPQSAWAPLGCIWPPPSFFDSSAFTVVSNTTGSVTMRSSEVAALRLTRHIELMPNGALRISVSAQKDERNPNPPQLPEALTFWSVTQLRPTEDVSFSLVPPYRVQNIQRDGNNPISPEPVRTADNKLLVKTDFPSITIVGQKCFADADALTFSYPGGYKLTARILDGSPDPNAEAPDQAQLFLGRHRQLEGHKDAAYMEVEFAAPLTFSKPLTVELSF